MVARPGQTPLRLPHRTKEQSASTGAHLAAVFFLLPVQEHHLQGQEGEEAGNDPQPQLLLLLQALALSICRGHMAGMEKGGKYPSLSLSSWSLPPQPPQAPAPAWILTHLGCCCRCRPMPQAAGGGTRCPRALPGQS